MSTLVTNTITGLSTAANITIGSTPVVSASANSLTVRGEGSAQTSVQQGLVKSWNSASNAAVTADSFNQGSGTDNGTGNYTYSFTNNMGNVNYCASGTVSQDNAEHFVISARAVDTYTVRTEDGDDGTTASDRANSSLVHGDLA